MLRSTFSSSSLVRLLGDRAGLAPDADAGGMDFAERLSLWLNAFDAIGLQAAHQAIRAGGAAVPSPARPRPVAPAVLEAEVQRVRAALARAIGQELPQPDPPAHAPFQQRQLELQRQMEQAIRPLRQQVRQALVRASPRLRQLATLDAVFEHVLAPREQALLPTAATLLERRFGQLRAADSAMAAAASASDAPASSASASTTPASTTLVSTTLVSTTPASTASASDAPREDDLPGPSGAGWLATFVDDWRQALLAELDLRLQPVEGLVGALREHTDQRP